MKPRPRILVPSTSSFSPIQRRHSVRRTLSRSKCEEPPASSPTPTNGPRSCTVKRTLITRTGWQGFNVCGHEYLDDYSLRVDGKPLGGTDAVKTTSLPGPPHPHLLRWHHRAGHVARQHRRSDGGTLGATPGPSGSHPMAHRQHGLRRLCRRPQEGSRADCPPKAFCQIVPGGLSRLACRPPDPDCCLWRPPPAMRIRFAPVALVRSRRRSQTVVFAVGDDRQETEAMARRVQPLTTRYFEARRARMEGLLTRSLAFTKDPLFDKALAVGQTLPGRSDHEPDEEEIFAGLPWFNNCWRRDTFISLPGATLVTGRYREAKEILRSFADYQQRDSTSTDYGRIPNIVTLTDRAYNTADGTPWFTIMAKVRPNPQATPDSCLRSTPCSSGQSKGHCAITAIRPDSSCMAMRRHGWMPSDRTGRGAPGAIGQMTFRPSGPGSCRPGSGLPQGSATSPPPGAGIAFFSAFAPISPPSLFWREEWQTI